MSLIIGIDPSLTSTGVAMIEGEGVRANVIRTRGKRSDTLAERLQRMQEITKRVSVWWPQLNGPSVNEAELVVIEGPTPGAKGGSPWDRAYLWWSIVAAFGPARVGVVYPATRAKWATGSGKADKAAVAAVAGRLCPDVELISSDAADALILALMGAHALGQRDDLDTKYRREALLKATWPEHTTARLLEPYEQVQKEVLHA